MHLRQLSLHAALTVSAALCIQASDTEGIASSDLAGRVYDEATGLALFGARVEVVGSGEPATTDLSGSFRLRAPGGGVVSVRVTKEGYAPVEVTGVVLPQTAEAPLQVSLAPAPEQESATGAASAAPLTGQPAMLEVMSVDASVVANSAADVVALRQASAGALNAIGKDDLSKLVSTDVSSAILRVPGVSVASSGGAQFAVIRGLSERYNPVLLDGIPMPSPDPERQSPQLDVFPTRLMDTIVVHKTAAPDLPSTSSGGAVDLQTQAFPTHRFADVRTGIRWSEEVPSGASYLTYPAGRWDYFGRGTESRADAPGRTAGSVGNLPDGEPLTVTQRRLPPGYQFAANLGDVVQLDDSGRELGYSFSTTYDSTYDTDEIERRSFTAVAVPPAVLQAGGIGEDASARRTEITSEERVLIGLYGVVGLKLSPAHQFTASVLRVQAGSDEATLSGPFFRSQSEAIPTTTHELYYRERTLTSYRLGGRHLFSTLGDLGVDWNAARVTTGIDEPDYRYFAFRMQASPGQPVEQYAVGTNSQGNPRPSSRTWRRGTEAMDIGRIDFNRHFDSTLIEGVKVQAGVSYEDTGRGYHDESYALTSAPAGATVPAQLSGVIAGRPADDPIYTGNGFSDSSATRTVADVHAGVDIALKTWWDLSLGVKREALKIDSEGSARLGNANSAGFYVDNPELGVVVTNPSPTTRFDGKIDESKTLPSVRTTFRPWTETNVRLAWSRTTARPSFRELGQYYTYDSLTDDIQHGNVALTTSEVENLDARVERFFGGADLVAAGVFWKRIANPIEKINAYSNLFGTIQSWANNPDDALVLGAELEARKGLGFLAAALEDVSLGGNFTWIDASVAPSPIEVRGKTQFGLPIAEERPLYDQPKWIANADVTFAPAGTGFSTTFSLFMTSSTLEAASSDNFDYYRSGYHQLDWSVSQKFLKSWSVRFTARNLTNPRRDIILDPEMTDQRYTVRSLRDGRSYSVSVSKSF